jgi:NAD(P)H-dependent FMN reductase
MMTNEDRRGVKNAQKCGMELTMIFSQIGMDVGLSSALTGFAGFTANVFQTAKQTDPRLLEMLVMALNEFLKSEGIEFVVMSAED